MVWFEAMTWYFAHSCEGLTPTGYLSVSTKHAANEDAYRVNPLSGAGSTMWWTARWARLQNPERAYANLKI